MSNGNHDRSDYDSFMIRLWHGATGERLLRAEIDHIQTGAVYVGRQVPADWIGQTVRASIRQRADAQGMAAGDRDSNHEEDDHVL
jgi:hypothetical protein